MRSTDFPASSPFAEVLRGRSSDSGELEEKANAKGEPKRHYTCNNAAQENIHDEIRADTEPPCIRHLLTDYKSRHDPPARIT